MVTVKPLTLLLKPVGRFVTEAPLAPPPMVYVVVVMAVPAQTVWFCVPVAKTMEGVLIVRLDAAVISPPSITETGPAVVPKGIVTVMEVLLFVAMGTRMPLSVTPMALDKLVPVMVRVPPIQMGLGDILVIEDP